MLARDGAVTSALGWGRDRKAFHTLRRVELSRRSPRPPSVECSCWGSSPPTRQQGGHLRSGPPSAGRAPWPAAPAQPRPLRHRGQFPGSLAGRRGEGRGFLPCLLAVFTGRDRDLSVTPAASVAPGRAPALILTGWFRRWVLTTPVPRPAAPNVWVASPRPDGTCPGRLPTSPAP